MFFLGFSNEKFCQVPIFLYSAQLCRFLFRSLFLRAFAISGLYHGGMPLVLISWC